LLNRQPRVRGGRIDLVLDSGCTMTCHPIASDLINHRPSNETMSGIDGKPQRVKLVGDLPIIAKDKRRTTPPPHPPQRPMHPILHGHPRLSRPDVGRKRRRGPLRQPPQNLRARR
jgi:hypothetical protein